MMKITGLIVFSSILLGACNNDGPAKITMDSVGKKFDSAAEKLYDSTRERAKILKDKIVHKLNQKDSAGN